MEFEFNKYRYSFDENGCKSIISLESNATPDSIGKYISFSQNHEKEIDKKIESLIKGQLYATEIDKLNDVSEGLQLNNIASHLVQLQNGGTVTSNDIVSFCHLCIGIVSFTQCPYNLFMWGLYTGNKGFFVEYNSHELIESVRSKSTFNITNLFPVRYEDNYKSFAQELYEMQAQDIWHKLFPAVSTKFDVWKSENEYRLVAFIKSDEVQNLFKTRLRIWDGGCTEGEVSRHLDYDVCSIRRIIIAFHFFDRRPNFKPKEGSIVRFQMAKQELGISKTALLEFCEIQKIPVFKLDMTFQEPIIFLLNIKDEGDRFAFEYDEEIRYSKHNDYK